MISSIQQYQHNDDGSISLKGHPNIKVEPIQEQDLERATAEAAAFDRALGLPQYFEQWAALSCHTGMSDRRLSFVIMDESESRLVGNPRYQPRTVALPPSCLLEFGHRGFVVGVVNLITRCFDGTKEGLRAIGYEVPGEVEGACLIGEAQLFNSSLADKAWEAIERGLFTHVCPVLFKEPHEALGGGKLVEVSLVTGSVPGCKNAKILRGWE